LAPLAKLGANPKTKDDEELQNLGLNKQVEVEATKEQQQGTLIVEDDEQEAI
jgi:hypothetical protein